MKINDLKNSSSRNIHFVKKDIPDLKLSLPEILIMEGSIYNIVTEDELFNIIAQFMNFPSYFGKNWDALSDCLKDMQWAPAKGYVLILRDSVDAWSKNPYMWGIFIEVWMAVSEFWRDFDIPFHLIFLME